MQRDDLFTLVLTDGLPMQCEGKTLRYRVVHLRETNVGDERAAQRAAERVMVVGGAPKLLVSEADFRYAMTLRHIDALECDGQRIGQGVLDLDMLGKLSSHDLGLIEQRVFLINIAAEVRYGNLSEADFDAVMAGQALPGHMAPQRGGQVAELGQLAAQPQPGPALLADFVGGDAHGTPAGPGQ